MTHGIIHATVDFYPAHPPERGNYGQYQLSAEDEACFECPLPECNEYHPLCPWLQGVEARRKQQRIAKAVQRAKEKWDREVDEAVKGCGGGG